MKFEYDEDRERGDMVAYIDEDGWLCIYQGDGLAVAFSPDTHQLGSGLVWNPHDSSHRRRFYRGDKLTITF